MGRPKKSLFPCKYCEKIFKREINLEHHLKSHSNTSGESRRARIRSNWCHVCRQSFSKSEYALHIMTEHQHDSRKIYSGDSEDNVIFNNDNYISRNKYDKQGKDKSPSKSPKKKVPLKKESQLVDQPSEDDDIICSNDDYISPNKYDKQRKDKSPLKSSKKKVPLRKETQLVDQPSGDDDIICNNDDYILPNKYYKQGKDRSPSKSPKKKVPLKKETQQVDQHSDIFKCKASLKKRGRPSVKSLLFTCSQCRFKSKSLRGLKIHLGTIHKSNKSHYKHKSSTLSLSDSKIEPDEFDEVEPDETPAECKNSAIHSSNSQPFVLQNIPTNFFQNTQAGFINNPVPIQTYPMSNNIGSGYQPSNFNQSTEKHPNVQFVPVVLNQNSVETIPKFDYKSEKYIKWLKKFVYRCKTQKYPLSPALCKSVNHIFREISDILHDPSGPLELRSNHFYFKRFRSLLSEVMLGQLRYSMDVVKGIVDA